MKVFNAILISSIALSSLTTMAGQVDSALGTYQGKTPGFWPFSHRCSMSISRGVNGYLDVVTRDGNDDGQLIRSTLMESTLEAELAGSATAIHISNSDGVELIAKNQESVEISLGSELDRTFKSVLATEVNDIIFLEGHKKIDCRKLKKVN